MEVVTLDSYVEANDLDVGLIKVDIEGFEKNSLWGLKKQLENMLRF